MYHSGPLAGTRLFLGGCTRPPCCIASTRRSGSRPCSVIASVPRSWCPPIFQTPARGCPPQSASQYDNLEPALRPCRSARSGPVEVKHSMIDWLGDVLWESYGASEVGTTCLIGSAEWRERPGSVGPGHPAVSRRSSSATTANRCRREPAAGCYFRDNVRGTACGTCAVGVGRSVSPGPGEFHPSARSG